MTLKPSTSLAFNGRCKEAFEFYERTLGGKITFSLTWGDSPMAKDAPPEFADKIVHASLEIGNAHFHGGDLPPGVYQTPQGFSITLSMDDAVEAERIFNALADGGTIRMPLQETFWAKRFGSVTDRFGINWEVNCENPAGMQ